MLGQGQGTIHTGIPEVSIARRNLAKPQCVWHGAWNFAANWPPPEDKAINSDVLFFQVLAS